MDWHLTIDRNGDALTSILVALAAMAGLFEAARTGLPLDTYRALLRPLWAAEAAAARLSQQPGPHDPVAMARLRLRLLVLCRVIAGLRRRLLRAGSRFVREPARQLRQLRADLQCLSPGAVDHEDTS